MTWERWFPGQLREVQAKEERGPRRSSSSMDDTRHLKTKDLLDPQEGPVLSELLLAEKIKEQRYRKWRVDTVVLKF